jgi:anti-anti-sigma factor
MLTTDDEMSPSTGTCVDVDLLTMTLNAVVVLDGELDYSTERAVTRRIARLAETADVIEIDTRPVTFIDAAGVRTLQLAKRSVVENGATMKVEVSRPGPVERVFALVGLSNWLD